MIWFDDVRIGDETEIGGHEFSAEEIVAFAREFDPQPFHLSDDAAAKTHFGRLAASGWHTAAIWMRLMVAHMQHEASLADAADLPADFGPSPGFEAMKWPKPVLAGDRVRYVNRIVAKRLSASRPGWGLISSLNRGFNQHGDLVFEFQPHVFARSRPSQAEADHLLERAAER